MEATRILAIRHGETAWNVDTRIQGQLDIPLNPTGLQQARWLAEAFAEIEAELPDHAQHWRKRTPEWSPPGEGESLIALRERVLGVVDALAARHVGQQIVVVAHGGVMDVLYRAATRLALQAPRTWQLPNTAVNRLLWTPEGLSLVGRADTTHLDGRSLDESTA